LAGLGRKEFNSGDILLASEVQGYLQDQAVMVFDDATARGSAIPSPSEGMLTYNKDTDQLELYDGSAFGPVGSDSGLIHIKQVSTGGAVSSVNIDDCFSATYNAYRIITDVAASTSDEVRVRLRVGGASQTGSIYRHQNIRGDGTSLTGVRSVNVSSWVGVHFTEANKVVSNSFEIYNPFETVPTSAQTSFYLNVAGNIDLFLRGFGINNSVSYTGFEVLTQSGTIDGTITVLGYRK